jgi:hypothetical protein
VLWYAVFFFPNNITYVTKACTFDVTAMQITCGLIFHAVDPSQIQQRKEEEWKRRIEK